jgi:hypothetical protein
VPLRDVYFTILNSYFELGVPSFGTSTKRRREQADHGDVGLSGLDGGRLGLGRRCGGDLAAQHQSAGGGAAGAQLAW